MIKFQFLNGAIKIDNAAAITAGLTVFQFLNGAIKI